MVGPTFAVLHQGKRQVGKATRDLRAALQKAYDLASEHDLNKLSPKQIKELSFDIVEVP